MCVCVCVYVGFVNEWVKEMKSHGADPKYYVVKHIGK